MRISDWSSDVCSSDLLTIPADIRLADDRHRVSAGPDQFGNAATQPSVGISDEEFAIQSQLLHGISDGAASIERFPLDQPSSIAPSQQVAVPFIQETDNHVGLMMQQQHEGADALSNPEIGRA